MCGQYSSARVFQVQTIPPSHFPFLPCSSRALREALSRLQGHYLSNKRAISPLHRNTDLDEVSSHKSIQLGKGWGLQSRTLAFKSMLNCELFSPTVTLQGICMAWWSHVPLECHWAEMAKGMATLPITRGCSSHPMSGLYVFSEDTLLSFSRLCNTMKFSKNLTDRPPHNQS